MARSTGPGRDSARSNCGRRGEGNTVRPTCLRRLLSERGNGNIPVLQGLRCSWPAARRPMCPTCRPRPSPHAPCTHHLRLAQAAEQHSEQAGPHMPAALGINEDNERGVGHARAHVLLGSTKIFRRDPSSRKGVRWGGGGGGGGGGKHSVKGGKKQSRGQIGRTTAAAQRRPVPTAGHHLHPACLPAPVRLPHVCHFPVFCVGCIGGGEIDFIGCIPCWCCGHVRNVPLTATPGDGKRDGAGRQCSNVGSAIAVWGGGLQGAVGS